MDFWGLLIAGKSSRSAISRPRPLHRRRSVGGLLQRFATWRNLLAVSSSDRAYKESPGRVSDRERSPDLGLGRRLPSQSHPLETAKNQILWGAWLPAGWSVSEKFSYQQNFPAPHSGARGRGGEEDFMGRAQPCADFFFGKKMGGKRWGLLCSAFFTRKIFRAA